MDKPSIGSVYPTNFRSNKNAERKWRTSQKLGLVIALVPPLSILAVFILVEPVKVWTQRWFQKRELRRCLYHEVVHNYTGLQMQVELANHDPEMKEGIGQRLAD